MRRSSGSCRRCSSNTAGTTAVLTSYPYLHSLQHLDAIHARSPELTLSGDAIVALYRCAEICLHNMASSRCGWSRTCRRDARRRGLERALAWRLRGGALPPLGARRRGEPIRTPGRSTRHPALAGLPGLPPRGRRAPRRVDVGVDRGGHRHLRQGSRRPDALRALQRVREHERRADLALAAERG